MLGPSKVPKTCELILSYAKMLKHPVSIKEITERIGIKYETVKHCLHKLVKLGTVKRLRPGVYALPDFTIPELKLPMGEGIVINGAIGSISTSNESISLCV